MSRIRCGVNLGNETVGAVWTAGAAGMTGVVGVAGMAKVARVAGVEGRGTILEMRWAPGWARGWGVIGMLIGFPCTDTGRGTLCCLQGLVY